MEREKQLYNVDPERSALKDLVDAWGTPQGAQKEYELHLREAALAKMEAWARRADEQSVPVAFRQWLADQALQLQQAKAAVNNDAVTEVVEKWKNIPDKYVGGGGADPLKAAKRASELTDALRNIHGIKGRGDVRNQASYRKFQEQGVVQLPEGGHAYHPNTDTANKIEAAITQIPSWRKNLEDMRDLLTARGVSTAAKLNPTDRAKMEVLAAQSVFAVKAMAGEALSLGEDEKFWGPLRGANTQTIWRLANDSASLDQAIEATKQFDRNQRARLRKVPADVAEDLTEPLVPPRPPSFREVK